VAGQPADGSVRVAELVATLSYAADLGLGQPMAHCMRQTVIALRLADLVGASAEDRVASMLSARGVRFVLAVVPDKTSVETAHLPSSYPQRQCARDGDRAFRERLKSDP
jgi:hypothetical protein